MACVYYGASCPRELFVRLAGVLNLYYVLGSSSCVLLLISVSKALSVLPWSQGCAGHNTCTCHVSSRLVSSQSVDSTCQHSPCRVCIIVCRAACTAGAPRPYTHPSSPPVYSQGHNYIVSPLTPFKNPVYLNYRTRTRQLFITFL
ncbi:hypothetical protein Pcinc_036665 [Petrolisthes cinctipes]|uniref:Uncharacterized protein n=1 Tax=Petrolisthes cinctipes TaxID=88211 RepID=A0AAE1BXG5_PETCI|nr:hypothetical protein Pcinc_036665 [Petrolisthes cinctipes]